jgi:hypothetical protein
LGVQRPAQTPLPRRPSQHAPPRRAVVGLSSSTAPFMRSTAWRVEGLVAFCPRLLEQPIRCHPPVRSGDVALPQRCLGLD